MSIIFINEILNIDTVTIIFCSINDHLINPSQNSSSKNFVAAKIHYIWARNLSQFDNYHLLKNIMKLDYAFQCLWIISVKNARNSPLPFSGHYLVSKQRGQAKESLRKIYNAQVLICAYIIYILYNIQSNDST
jgi:hypothetical protein